MLTPDELSALDSMADSLRDRPEAAELGRSVADSLRQSLPDLDDETIARVTVRLAALLGTLATEARIPEAAHIALSFYGIAVELSSLAREADR